MPHGILPQYLPLYNWGDITYVKGVSNDRYLLRLCLSLDRSPMPSIFCTAYLAVLWSLLWSICVTVRLRDFIAHDPAATACCLLWESCSLTELRLQKPYQIQGFAVPVFNSVIVVVIVADFLVHVEARQFPYSGSIGCFSVSSTSGRRLIYVAHTAKYISGCGWT